MAAAKGNKYAEKYTLEETRKFFEQCLAYVDQDPTAYHFSKISRRFKTHKDIFNYLINKFPNDKEFRHYKKRIVDILEDNIISAISTKQIPEAFGIFNLKCNFEWRDKQERVEVYSMGEEEIKSYVLDRLLEKSKAESK